MEDMSLKNQSENVKHPALAHTESLSAWAYTGKEYSLEEDQMEKKKNQSHGSNPLLDFPFVQYATSHNIFHLILWKNGAK